MDIEQRLEKLTERVDSIAQSVEILAGMHRENEKLMTQVLESIARLAHVAEIHEQRISDLEKRG